MPLSEVGRLIGVSPRAMANRYEAGKRGAELFAPAKERYRWRGWNLRSRNWIIRPREYRSWQAMIQRCRNPANPRYADYGGRGIDICERWQSFDNFLADMGERPEGRSLDRYPNNNGNYEPGNCRWATLSQQARNKRPRKKVSDIAAAPMLCDIAGA